ncbi:MAG: hypothetical protein HOD92_07895 [Deltaproteobacteria bacterium]|nr:hypothetical protein [Deltaproteobacteria bacterium]MBT4525744.1 hypothetical protein [Deltaproteobacteria bacterium]
MQDKKQFSAEVEPETQKNKLTIDPSDLRALVSNYLNEAETQKRLKKHLQDAIHEELANMSLTLRHAIREWVEKEKKKHNFEQVKQENLQLEEKLGAINDQNHDLAAENKKLKRKMELKEHENKLILLSLKQLNQKK